MPPSRNIVVIGGSAGAIEGLLQIVGALPSTISASIFVVVHVPSASTSVLPTLLARAGALRAKHAVDGEATECGVIYVAPPDLHLLVKRGCARVVRGPRENGYRPAIDALFRSAAASYGRHVTGVILSGNLDDGSAGVVAIHAAGGSVVVQSPEDALYPGMPRNALASVPSATVLPIEQIADHLDRMVRAHASPRADITRRDVADSSDPLDPVELESDTSESFVKLGIPSGLTCPECHGRIFELALEAGGTPQYRCRVGHAFSTESLFAEQRASLEAALRTALRALEECAQLARRVRARAQSRTNERAARMYTREARICEARARVIRELLRVSLPLLGEGSGSAVPGTGDE